VLISAALLCFTVPTLRYDRFLCGVVLITYMLVRNKVDYLDTRYALFATIELLAKIFA
jgi:hypothetical protein